MTLIKVVKLATVRKIHGSIIGNRILDSHQKSAFTSFSTCYKLTSISITPLTNSILQTTLYRSPVGNTIVSKSTTKAPIPAPQLMFARFLKSTRGCCLSSIPQNMNLPPSHNDLAILGSTVNHRRHLPFAVYRARVSTIAAHQGYTASMRSTGTGLA